jgi:hypothetical protein
VQHPAPVSFVPQGASPVLNLRGENDRQGKCEGSSSFLKKRTKKLLPVQCAPTFRPRQPIEQKFFGSFFQKRTASFLF